MVVARGMSDIVTARSGLPSTTEGIGVIAQSTRLREFQYQRQMRYEYCLGTKKFDFLFEF